MAFLLASLSERLVSVGTSTSRPWMAMRMARYAEKMATATIASAPRRMLKKRLMVEIFMCQMSGY